MLVSNIVGIVLLGIKAKNVNPTLMPTTTGRKQKTTERPLKTKIGRSPVTTLKYAALELTNKFYQNSLLHFLPENESRPHFNMYLLSLFVPHWVQ